MRHSFLVVIRAIRWVVRWFDFDMGGLREGGCVGDVSTSATCRCTVSDGYLTRDAYCVVILRYWRMLCTQHLGIVCVLVVVLQFNLMACLSLIILGDGTIYTVPPLDMITYVPTSFHTVCDDTYRVEQSTYQLWNLFSWTKAGTQYVCSLFASKSVLIFSTDTNQEGTAL